MTGSGLQAAPSLSVVLATYNRRTHAERLLRQLAGQTLPRERFELVIVDDGSSQPLATWLPELRLPYEVTAVRQANGGAASARHRGALAARGEVLVITDDDMQLPPEFLEAHLEQHPPGSRRAVVGRIRSSSQLAAMPVFERFHAELLDRWPSRALHGDAVCTGNLSLRRADYLQVGGFDLSLERAEDIDLGYRLERAGVEIVYAERAFSIHDSDHTDFAVWRQRAVRYGRCWTRIGRKHPDLLRADPWRLFFSNAPAKRPFVAVAAVAPTLGGWLGALTQRAAQATDRLGFERLALRLTSLLFDLEFFRGVRAEAGSLPATVRSCRGFLERAAAAGSASGLGRGARGLAGIVGWLRRRRS